MELDLTPEVLRTIVERILRRDIIGTMKFLRGLPEIGTLARAKDYYEERYDLLRAMKSDDFVCDHRDYWGDFYS